MTAEAETGVMCLQGKEHRGFLQPQEARRKTRLHFPGASGGRGALPTARFWTPSVRGYISVVLSHPDCGNFYHSPRKLIKLMGGKNPVKC